MESTSQVLLVSLPRCCPVLCGLRDRCIAAMLATLVAVRKDGDTKAELNCRGQACEVLADTGIRVAENQPLIIANPR